MKDQIPYLAGDELAQLQAVRRELHSYPELMWTEFWTTATIHRKLEELGYETMHGRELYRSDVRKKVPNTQVMQTAYNYAGEKLGNFAAIEKMQGGFTGVIARIKAGNGPKLGFRFDIDALPVIECDAQHHLPAKEQFTSKNSNMHACGHDGHAAIGLGLAKKIRDNLDLLSGEYYFLFQPAEEGGLGGLAFAQLEWVQNLDFLIAVHLGLLNARKFVCALDFLHARTYTIRFRGRTAHSAVAPHRGCNALLAATTAVNNLYAISRHGDGGSRINVGKFRADNAVNIIADNAIFDLELRGESGSILDYMVDSAYHILQGAAQMHDVQVEISEKTHHINVPASPSLKQQLKQAAIAAGVPESAIVDHYLAMGCEDAPFIMEKVQQNGGSAAYVCLACPTYGGHHHCQFDFDEDMMLWGVKIFWEFIRNQCSMNVNRTTHHSLV